VPNAFTPNQDGENDWFKPVLSNLDLVRFDVFSRWGELMWNMEAGEDRGWDGNVLGAKQATPGMYIWKLEAKELNGTILTRSGSINLIR
jgi:gliding motility-associated-like protein